MCWLIRLRHGAESRIFAGYLSCFRYTCKFVLAYNFAVACKVRQIRASSYIGENRVLIVTNALIE